MAMDGNIMGQEIMTEIENLSDEDKSNGTAVWKAVCRAIVSHIQTNGIVNPGIACSVDPGTHLGKTTGTGSIG